MAIIGTPLRYRTSKSWAMMVDLSSTTGAGACVLVVDAALTERLWQAIGAGVATEGTLTPRLGPAIGADVDALSLGL